jgi:hypothetical protein
MFMQRRFEHAVIACRFYPNLFRDGESILQLDIDNSSIVRRSPDYFLLPHEPPTGENILRGNKWAPALCVSSLAN